MRCESRRFHQFVRLFHRTFSRLWNSQSGIPVSTRLLRLQSSNGLPTAWLADLPTLRQHCKTSALPSLSKWPINMSMTFFSTHSWMVFFPNMTRTDAIRISAIFSVTFASTPPATRPKTSTNTVSIAFPRVLRTSCRAGMLWWPCWWVIETDSTSTDGIWHSDIHEFFDGTFHCGPDQSLCTSRAMGAPSAPSTFTPHVHRVQLVHRIHLQRAEFTECTGCTDTPSVTSAPSAPSALSAPSAPSARLQRTECTRTHAACLSLWSHDSM